MSLKDLKIIDTYNIVCPSDTPDLIHISLDDSSLEICKTFKNQNFILHYKFNKKYYLVEEASFLESSFWTIFKFKPYYNTNLFDIYDLMDITIPMQRIKKIKKLLK